MNTLKATVKGGRLEVDVPAEWGDGTEVEIHPVGPDARNEDGPMSPDEIARIRAAMEKMLPFEMTGEEEVEIEAQRQRNKDYTITNMHKGIEELFP